MVRETQSAAARRRATTEPGVFVIPSEQLPPGFAERLESSTHVPAPARAAATVVLLREAGPARSIEALLLRRPSRSRFAADAWVFPGGAVDDADADPRLRAFLDGPADEAWAKRLGLEVSEARGYVVAALREAWEETGILLGGAERGAGLGEAREALLANAQPLDALLRQHGIRLDSGRLIYLAHWITPEPEPRRYDTRFFAARVDADAVFELSGDELVEAAWVEPADAVERFRRGEMTLLPPTVETLQRLAGFSSIEAAWSELAEAAVPAILPRMRRTAEGVEIRYDP
jgi:8-oxo-dGTP pyrophosphatase MutT (NUDIX family)